MASVLGLSTYRWNNNIKSVLLLLAFPLLLMALLGGIFYVFGWVYADPVNHTVNPYVFGSLHIHSMLGTGRPEDLALAGCRCHLGHHRLFFQ
jgi:hypothetical protein